MNPRLERSRLTYLAATEGAPTKKHQAWVETPIGDAWVGAARVVLRDGRPVIAELRVFPAEAPTAAGLHLPGQWSGTVNAEAPIPGDGLTFKVLRQFKPSMVFNHIAEMRAASERSSADYWKSRGVEVEEPARAKDPRGRKASRPPKFYAELARDYAAMVKSGSKRPSADLATARGMSRPLMRALVNRAREQYGFLDKARPGVTGGTLTDSARAELRKRPGKAKR